MNGGFGYLGKGNTASQPLLTKKKKNQTLHFIMLLKVVMSRKPQSSRTMQCLMYVTFVFKWSHFLKASTHFFSDFFKNGNGKRIPQAVLVY